MPATSPTFASLNDLPSTQTKRYSRDEALHSARSRFPRLPLPFNDADEVSCRARAIKCSRCRASFAPIRTAVAESELVPPLNRPLADPLSETKNSPNAQNVFPACRNQSYSAVSRLVELTSRSGTRVFDEPGPKRRCRLTTDCRIICAGCFFRARKGDVFRGSVYRDYQGLSSGQVHVLNQYDQRLHA
jgi:hypothetical protein